MDWTCHLFSGGHVTSHVITNNCDHGGDKGCSGEGRGAVREDRGGCGGLGRLPVPRRPVCWAPQPRQGWPDLRSICRFARSKGRGVPGARLPVWPCLLCSTRIFVPDTLSSLGSLLERLSPASPFSNTEKSVSLSCLLRTPQGQSRGKNTSAGVSVLRECKHLEAGTLLGVQ